MVRINNEQRIQLRKRARRRVVGAVVLVVIAVIVLPILFEPIPNQKGQEIRIIFPTDNLQDNSVKPATQQDKESNVLKDQTQRNKYQEGNKTHSNGEVGPGVKNTGSNPINEKFIVQLGAFSDSIKAKNQQQSLILSGIQKAYIEKINNNGKEITRVRVGPFFSYDRAKREQEKLKKIGVIGVVISL
tara:strand:+ start:16260 stop:16820 length:561 start_codon:yes stop_codon:yes gene_type:complete